MDGKDIGAAIAALVERLDRIEAAVLGDPEAEKRYRQKRQEAPCPPEPTSLLRTVTALDRRVRQLETYWEWAYPTRGSMPMDVPPLRWLEHQLRRLSSHYRDRGLSGAELWDRRIVLEEPTPADPKEAPERVAAAHVEAVLREEAERKPPPPSEFKGVVGQMDASVLAAMFEQAIRRQLDRQPRRCPECAGTGQLDAGSLGSFKCGECQGTGEVALPRGEDPSMPAGVEWVAFDAGPAEGEDPDA